MFANFIYFILALLIFATYHPSGAPGWSPLQTGLGILVLAGGFWAYARSLYRGIALLAERGERYLADHRFGNATRRLSILALVIFAFIVHGLEAPALVSGAPLFETVPTLSALVFLGLFVGLLTVVWASAWEAHSVLYDPQGSRSEYVGANLRLSLPVLIPWVLISGIADLVFALPFEAPKRFLASPEGELVYFLFFLVIASVFAPLLVHRFWGCTPLEPGYHRSRIEALCRRAGVAYRNILYWPIFGGRMMTAGVMGLVGRFRYILVTRSLLRSLTDPEFDSVIAHEIGHVKNHHLLCYMLFIAGFIVVSSLVGILFEWTPVVVASYLPWLVPVVEFTHLHLGPAVVLGGLLIVTFLLYFRFLFGYFMRNFERQADIYVYRFFPSALPMVSTFEKIVRTSGQSDDRPNWHHFSIRERIGYLLRCEGDRKWIGRHNRKVAASLGIYLCAMAALAWGGYHLGFGESRKAIGEHLLRMALQNELGDRYTTAALYQFLGDLRYGQQDEAGAAAAYEKALSVDPDRPEVLNNLAWLLATAQTPSLRDPKRALRLAIRAVELDPSPHALDTLAESYFINNDPSMAVRTALRALEAAEDNREYYIEQLERFRKTVGSGRQAI